MLLHSVVDVETRFVLVHLAGVDASLASESPHRWEDVLTCRHSSSLDYLPMIILSVEF
jgi:hypothetical protein